MSNSWTLEPESYRLLENPNNDSHDIYGIWYILYHAKRYSDEDIHVIKGAVIHNRYWGRYNNAISYTDDPRLLIPFLDDDDPNIKFDLAEILHSAIVFGQFEKARILIEHGADIEASREYARASEMRRYEAKICEFIPPAVKSANKV
jgi:ankyrin repeat protein